MTIDLSSGGGRECHRVIFRGRVQGVGFRFTTTMLAHDLSVYGYVRNMESGSVELVVEALPDQFDALMKRIRERFVGQITGCEIVPYQGEEAFESFDVRY